jgi:putative aminopeptidase FrvX
VVSVEVVNAFGAQPDQVESWDPAHDMVGLIRALSGTAAPAGHEQRMTAALHAYLTSRGLQPTQDRLGQLCVSFGPQNADRTVMVNAHVDELGLVVRAIEPDGWLRVHRLGGMPERVLPGARLVVHARGGDLPAVCGVKSHHLTSPEEKYVGKPATALYLDVGLSDAASVRAAGVRVGDPVTYAPTFDTFPGDRFAGKSFDNRLGVAALLAAAGLLTEQSPQSRIHLAFSCQEEFNVRGTLALAARLRPDISVTLDITPATDTPDLRGEGETCLGGGPSLSRMTFHGRGTLGGLIPPPSLVDAVERAAHRGGVQLQYDAVVGVITDAAFLPMASADGIAAVGLGIPCRYTHSPIETAQLSDVQDTVTLLMELLLHAHDIDLPAATSPA